MTIINLTPHDVVLQIGTQTTVFPASGKVIRLTVEEYELKHPSGYPCVSRNFKGIEGITLQEISTSRDYFIVSSLVFDKMIGITLAKKMLVPDTGSTCIRDSAGKIVAVTRFISMD